MFLDVQWVENQRFMRRAAIMFCLAPQGMDTTWGEGDSLGVSAKAGRLDSGKVRECCVVLKRTASERRRLRPEI
jgi:hypothetical protein